MTWNARSIRSKASALQLYLQHRYPVFYNYMSCTLSPPSSSVPYPNQHPPMIIAIWNHR